MYEDCARKFAIDQHLQIQRQRYRKLNSVIQKIKYYKRRFSIVDKLLKKNKVHFKAEIID